MNTKYTTEELLKALDQIESDVEEINSKPEALFKQKKSKHYNQICKFIFEKKLARGSVRVPIYKIVHEYHKWAEKHATKPTPYEIGKVFREFFEFKRSGANRAFMLNDFCDMSAKARKSSKTFYKRFVLNKRDKNEKKEEQVCQPQSEVKSTIETGQS